MTPASLISQRTLGARPWGQWRCWLTFLILCAGQTSVAAADEAPENERTPLRIVVMDPLSLPLSCACVPGVGQKEYGVLGQLLGEALERPVEITYAESLAAAYRRSGRQVDLIIGPQSVVRHDAESTKTTVRPLLALADRQGSTQVRGVLLVRDDDPAIQIEDLAGRTIALGPVEMDECHAAVKVLLQASMLSDTVLTRASETVDEAVFALVDGEADVAVVPEYLPELLIGCQKVAPNSIRVIGTTEPTPFVQLFATESVGEDAETILVRALQELSVDEQLRTALESKTGFVQLPPDEKPNEDIANAGWTDWRGPRRDGHSSAVPRKFPEQWKALWTAEVTGPAMAGIVATSTHVVVADKDAALTTDIFRCFDAATGKEFWRVEHPSDGDVDYTNAPRATPVIHEGLVFLQGVWGNLHCAQLETGEIVWERHLVYDFAAELPTWGYSAPPLVVDGKLIVMPGARDAGLVALDLKSGETLWATPGHAAAYAPLIVGTFGGKRQIVGYDVAGLAGWDIETGERLWQLVPPGSADFNVGTPVAVDDKILVATENNATRLFRFREDGTIDPEPEAVNEELAPDTCTPVVVGERVYCTAYGELYCLDLKDALRTIWSRQDERFYDHTNLIAGNNRILMWTTTCDLVLLDAEAPDYAEVGAFRPFADDEASSMAHPALVGDRLYLRDGRHLVCYQLPGK